MSQSDHRINLWLEKCVAICIATCVSASAAFQWKLYNSNQDIISLIKIHDSRIMDLENRMSAVQSEIIATKSQMVGWDTLKRIELFLSTRTSKEIDSKMSYALRMELDSRREK